MDLRADFFFFLAILVFIFAAWVATGGPNRPISFAGPFITPISTYGEEQNAYGGSIWDWTPDSDGSWFHWTPITVRTSEDSAQQELWKTQDTLTDLQKELQDARLFGTPSVYRGKVSLSASRSVLGQTDESLEYVTISVSGKENVNISGWRLVSTRTRASATIPNGVTLYKTGRVNQTSPIILSPGERAIVSTGRSPVGVSFKENSCIGYLEDPQDYTPRLSGSCPTPLSDFERFYDGANKDYQQCRDTVSRLPRCETPSSRSGMSSSCYDFVRDHLTYNSCTTFHANDRNFWGNNWRVYLGKSDDLWPERNDTLKLLDANGHTVAIFSY